MRAGISVAQLGSYTYDTNNNMTGTMMASDLGRSESSLPIADEWTFTYDIKNRLKSHTNNNHRAV